MAKEELSPLAPVDYAEREGAFGEPGQVRADVARAPSSTFSSQSAEGIASVPPTIGADELSDGRGEAWSLYWEEAPATPDLTTGPEAIEEPPNGSRLLGVRLKKAGQVFFFPDSGHPVHIGSQVMVNCEHGPALGEIESIVPGATPLPAGDDAVFTGALIGLATAQDLARHAENVILEAEAGDFCKDCIRQRGLDMKLVEVEVYHDRDKIIFYFTAPSRIDFRELVKDLVRNYRTRIELRQIGVRHETQMIGAIGNCGRVCCCHGYLRKFAPVTIKMAKEQNLFLNPAKLSGMCGRLLCCLSFEQGNYEEFNRRCPRIGKRYATTSGTAKVLRTNMFNQSIVVLNERGEELELTLEAWDALTPSRTEPLAPEQQRAAATKGDREAPAPGSEGLDKESGRKAAHAESWPASGERDDDFDAENALSEELVSLREQEAKESAPGRPSGHGRSPRQRKRRGHESAS